MTYSSVDCNINLLEHTSISQQNVELQPDWNWKTESKSAAKSATLWSDAGEGAEQASPKE